MPSISILKYAVMPFETYHSSSSVVEKSIGVSPSEVSDPSSTGSAVKTPFSSLSRSRSPAMSTSEYVLSLPSPISLYTVLIFAVLQRFIFFTIASKLDGVSLNTPYHAKVPSSNFTAR